MIRYLLEKRLQGGLEGTAPEVEFEEEASPSLQEPAR